MVTRLIGNLAAMAVSMCTQSEPTPGAQPPTDQTTRAPTLRSMTPPIGQDNVDPSLSEITVVFDTPMSHDGYSFVGGGPHFPAPKGPARWTDAYTCVLPVQLKSNWEYAFSINGGKHRSFRSIWLVPAEPTPCFFKTAGQTAVALTPEQQRELNRESTDVLFDALRHKYSHRDRLGLDWEKLFAEHRSLLIDQPDTMSWVRAACAMLFVARDVHLTLELEGVRLPTFIREIHSNYSAPGVRSVLGEVRKLSPYVSVGATDDGIAYLLMATWSADAAHEVSCVEGELAGMLSAPALILDVRPNSGGSENLAKQIAAWFVDEPAVYARHVYRRGPGPNDFTPPRDRVLEPNEPARRFTAPVAVLTGPANMSSCESFLLMMKKAKNVTLIGETSYGACGNPAPTHLPNAAVAMIPSWRTETPDGVLLEGRGIEPDVTVPSEGVDFSGEDPVLRTAIQFLRERITPTQGRRE